MNLFIDTNIFLSFYHLSNDDLEEIHKLTVLLEKGDVVLWLPEQVINEFKRNRENKISDAMKKLQEQKKKPQFPQICKDYEEFPEIRDLQKEYDKKLSSLIKKLNDDIESRTLKADEKISELFQKAKIIKTNAELIEKARIRMAVRNPPGKDGYLGDAMNWEALLSSVPYCEKLYLVADDKDYYSVLNENKLKEFLVDEWRDVNNEDILFYRRLSQFFKEHYPDIKLASELEKELAINALVNSGSFSETHTAVAKLGKYAEFNKSQANDIAQAAINNSQVSWILGDKDVFYFYNNLLDTHKDIIEKEIFDELAEDLKVSDEETEES